MRDMRTADEDDNDKTADTSVATSQRRERALDSYDDGDVER